MSAQWIETLGQVVCLACGSLFSLSLLVVSVIWYKIKESELSAIVGLISACTSVVLLVVVGTKLPTWIAFLLTHDGSIL
jgi:hypothetical protein